MYIFIGIAVVLIAWIVISYNKVVALREAAYTDQKGIDIQLDERNKVFDSMIAAVKKYMSYEEGVFKDIVELRNKNDEGSEADIHKAQENLSELVTSGRLASGINMTMEAYPDLKASTNMLKLQETIESIERKLAHSKKAFNQSVEDYNAYTGSIPAVFIVGMFSSLKVGFVRWALSEEKIRASEERVVSFE